MASIADVYITCMPETSRIAPGIKDAFKKVDPDAREAGGRWAKEIESQLNDVKVKLDADTTKAKAEIDEVSRDRHSTVHLDVDKDSVATAASAMSALAQESSSLASTSSSAASSVGGLGESLGSLSAAAGPAGIAVLIGAAAAAVELAGVAASAAQALWLLPAAAGAAGAAVGTLALATHGFSDAIGDINDPKKFAADLQSLSPAAQQAALAIQRMMPSLTGLQRATQDALFAGVGPQLNQLVNQYLPTIQTMTTGIASAFNSMFSGVANQLMTPETQQAIQAFTTNVASAFQQLAPAIAPLTKAFADIMSVGSGFLPDLARAATDAARSFSVFITEAKQSGDLKKWIGEGLDTLKQLGGIAIELAKAFMALAPTGREVLPQISGMLRNISDIMPVITTAAFALGPPFGLWAVGIKQASVAFDAIKGVVTGVANAVIPVINSIGEALDHMFEPIRAAAKLIGIDIPHYTGITQFGSTDPSQGGLPGAQAARRGNSSGVTLPTAGISGVPDAGYGLPSGIGGLGAGVAPSARGGWTPAPNPYASPAPKAASSAINLPYAGTADPYGGMYSGGATGGYTTDAALLANVPAGRYTQDQRGDLTQGLADCSSAVEDLVNLMQGQSTAGASMSTGNEAAWLTQHGFLLTNQPMPGTFQVGFNPEHTQATLPGGTNFNWGSDAAAARGGVGGTGAWDPAFTSHYYLPGSGNPASAMYGDGMTPGSGLTSSDLSVRNAGQRVNDTQHSEEQAQARLNELKAKGTATDRQMEAAEYALAKAKREHQDAIDGLTVAQDKYNKSSQSGKDGNTDAEALGSGFLSGLGQIFGLDGSVFADPSSFGLFKIFQGAMGLKPKKTDGAGSGSGSGSGGGGGGGGLGGLFDLAKSFMPGMPGTQGGNSPNLVDAVQFAQPGGPGSPGPGNSPVGYQNTGIDLRGAQFGPTANEFMPALNSVTSSQNRWGPQLQNLPS